MSGEIADPTDPINEALIVALAAFETARDELREAINNAKQADLVDGMNHLAKTGEIDHGPSTRLDLIQQAISELVRDGLPYTPTEFPAKLPTIPED